MAAPPMSTKSDAPTSVIDLLRSMIRTPSVTPSASGVADSESALGELVAGYARQWGLGVQFLPMPGGAPNVLLTAAVDPAAPWRLFDSHLDTVGVEGMTIDPFGAELRDGRVYGRGACDTKGPGAAMLWALREVAAGPAPPVNLALLLTVGEEYHQVGARAYVDRQMDELGWRPEGVVVSEPTGMQVVAATNGFIRWRISTLGKAAHSSSPQLGRNAISDMAEVIRAIDQQYIARLDRGRGLTGGGSCSINGVSGGAQVNVVPESCSILVDRRLAPGEEADDALSAVDAILGEVSRGGAPVVVERHDIQTAPPMPYEPNAAWARLVASALRGAGMAAEVTGAPYTTNGNYYSAGGLPCVVVGPGDIGLAHTREESIGVQELAHGVEGYRALMRTESLPT